MKTSLFISSPFLYVLCLSLASVTSICMAFELSLYFIGPRVLSTANAVFFPLNVMTDKLDDTHGCFEDMDMVYR